MSALPYSFNTLPFGIEAQNTNGNRASLGVYYFHASVKATAVSLVLQIQNLQ